MMNILFERGINMRQGMGEAQYKRETRQTTYAFSSIPFRLLVSVASIVFLFGKVLPPRGQEFYGRIESERDTKVLQYVPRSWSVNCCVMFKTHAGFSGKSTLSLSLSHSLTCKLICVIWRVVASEFERTVQYAMHPCIKSLPSPTRVITSCLVGHSWIIPILLLP